MIVNYVVEKVMLMMIDSDSLHLNVRVVVVMLSSLYLIEFDYMFEVDILFEMDTYFLIVEQVMAMYHTVALIAAVVVVVEMGVLLAVYLRKVLNKNYQRQVPEYVYVDVDEVKHLLSRILYNNYP